MSKNKLVHTIHSRRHFLEAGLKTAMGISTLSLLSACESFDDYLFYERFSFKGEVVIIGGGISGLYLAQLLRNNHSEFRLFEGSSALGGRIRSDGAVDYGSSVLSKKDKLASLLVDEMNLTKNFLNKESYTISSGMGSLVSTMMDRIGGLIPYRNFRMRWRLIEVSKQADVFTLTFETPAGQKKIETQKIALAIPPTQWPTIKGLLELPEMAWAQNWLKSFETENSYKLILPVTAVASTSLLATQKIENLEYRLVKKKNKKAGHVELEVRFKAKDEVSVEAGLALIKKKLQLNVNFQKLGSEQFFDWGQLPLIGGGYFKNSAELPTQNSSHFRVIGDFMSRDFNSTIEGALSSAKEAAELFV